MSKQYHKRPDANTIKEAISPYDFYLSEQGLSRYGYRSGSWHVAGLCPFHDDRKAGSFKVNIDTGSFKCWSCGAAGSDIIAFLMQRYSIDFREALDQLSREWGVDRC